MSNQPNTDHQICTDDEAVDCILPPEAHDLIEVNQDLLLDLDSCAVYRIKSECRRDGCQQEFRGLKAVGRSIETVQDYRTIAYQLYESYYDNSRQTSYRVLQTLAQELDRGQRTAVANDLGNAAKLGCLDAEANREKRMDQEVFDEVLAENLEE